MNCKTIQTSLATLAKSYTSRSTTEPVVLTADQEKAKELLIKFLSTRDEHVFVLKGYAGTGKTTMVQSVLEHIPKADALAKMINPKHVPREIVLAATTHKAAEALSVATGEEVVTIHSHLGLIVRINYQTGETYLTRKSNAVDADHQIIFIDESSYIDEKLLNMILRCTHGCKIVFMGDPTQLSPVGCSSTPVFDQKFPEAELLKVVRQEDGNQIKEWSSGLREFIRGDVQEFPKIRVDGKTIVRVDRSTFDDMVLKEFTHPDWKMSQSKMLAWRNATVNKYNKALQKKASGRTDLAKGDYAVNNHFVTSPKNKESIKTDATVLVTDIREAYHYGFKGREVDTDKCTGLFMPDDYTDHEKAKTKALAKGDSEMLRTVKDSWCDLRAAYCCTVNKSQGSTFDRVFVDLDDITSCSDSNQMARMIYVAISRARKQVILTGG